MKFVLSSLMVISMASIALAADPVVGQGMHVKADYTLTVDNEQIESSVGKEPLEFDVGTNTIIPGLESQLMGMHEGEEKIVTVAAKDAYGEVDPKAVKEFPKSSMPKDAQLKAGMVLQAQSPDGEEFPAVIKEIKEDKVVLDFNHPLAGKTLQFKVKILKLAPAVAKQAPAEQAPALAPQAPAAK